MNPFAYITHPDCARHEIAPGHPEQPARIASVHAALRGAPEIAAALSAIEAPLAEPDSLCLAHDPDYVSTLLKLEPAPGEFIRLDPDTAINSYSLDAARRAAGAVIRAVDEVVRGKTARAFCNVRPPGHHAERDKAMGFCLFNSIAIGALHAIQQHGLQRVAVIDFDVHFGNGTSDILRDHDNILLLSSCQYPLYPLDEVPVAGRSEINIVLPPESDGNAFREAAVSQWFSALEAYAPQLVLISAGFDAHADDPLAGLNWQADDYAWVTSEIVRLTGAAHGIVSSLEGGYNLDALGQCALAHVQALIA